MLLEVGQGLWNSLSFKLGYDKRKLGIWQNVLNVDMVHSNWMKYLSP